MAGWGEIVSWTAPHIRDGETTKPAYVIALIQLDEGPWIYAQAGADSELSVGQTVKIGFNSVDGGEPLPVVAIPR